MKHLFNEDEAKTTLGCGCFIVFMTLWLIVAAATVKAAIMYLFVGSV